jgi:hypothetical protein
MPPRPAAAAPPSASAPPASATSPSAAPAASVVAPLLAAFASLPSGPAAFAPLSSGLSTFVPRSSGLSTFVPPSSGPAGFAPLPSGPAGGDAARLGIKPKRLKAALLAPADLPAGYKRLSKPIVTKGNLLAANGGTGITPGDRGCRAEIDLDNLLDPAKPTPARPAGTTVAVGLIKGKTGPVVTESLADGEAGSGRALVTETAGLIRRCPKITVDLKGSDQKIVVTQAPLQAPEIGDAQVAEKLTMQIGGTDPGIVFNAVVFAKGPVAGVVMVIGAAKDAGVFPTVVEAAAGKVRNLA